MITITVDVVHTRIITPMTNITTLVHADTEGLAHLITTTITGGDTGAAILGMMIAMILKMTIAGTAMVDVCADLHLRPPQQTLHNLAYNRCHMLPLYPLSQSEVYNQLERANNPLGFLMNKEERTLLDASLSSQTRIVRLDDVMNQKSIGNAMSKRNHGVDATTKKRHQGVGAATKKRHHGVGAATKKKNHGVDGVTKSFPIQEVPDDAPVTIQRIPASQVTMKDAHLSCVPPDRTMEMEALEPRTRTLPSPLCRLLLSGLVARWTMALLTYPHRPDPVGTMVS